MSVEFTSNKSVVVEWRSRNVGQMIISGDMGGGTLTVETRPDEEEVWVGLMEVKDTVNTQKGISQFTCAFASVRLVLTGAVNPNFKVYISPVYTNR